MHLTRPLRITTFGYRHAVALFELVLTVIVLLAIATAILLFERRRARQIEHDLNEQRPSRHERGED